MDIQEVIKQNSEKYKKKLEKQGVTSNKLNNYARMNTKSVDSNNAKSVFSQNEKEEAYKKAKTDIDYARSLTKNLTDNGFIPAPKQEMLQDALNWAIKQVQ